MFEKKELNDNELEKVAGGGIWTVNKYYARVDFEGNKGSYGDIVGPCDSLQEAKTTAEIGIEELVSSRKMISNNFRNFSILPFFVEADGSLNYGTKYYYTPKTNK